MKNNNGKIRIRNTNMWQMLFTVLALPHCNPPFLGTLRGVSNIIDIWRAASFWIIILTVVLIKKKFSVVSVLICAMQGYLLLDTYINHASVFISLRETFSIVSVVLLYDFAIQVDRKAFIKSQLLCFEIVIYINLLTEVLFPKGLYVNYSSNTLMITYKNWFLGYYNNYTQYFIPALLFAFLYRKETGKACRAVFLTIAIYVSALLVWSGGVLLALLSWGALYIYQKKKRASINFYNCWLIQILFYLLVIRVGILDIFRWLIDNLLGKWDSITGRMSLWHTTEELIKIHPIIGYGIENGIVREIKTGFRWGVHAHNLLLETVYRGGIIYLCLFFILILLCGMQLRKCRDWEVVRILLCCFASWSIHTLVEPYMTCFLVGMFVVASRSSLFNKSQRGNSTMSPGAKELLPYVIKT